VIGRVIKLLGKKLFTVYKVILLLKKRESCLDKKNT